MPGTKTAKKKTTAASNGNAITNLDGLLDELDTREEQADMDDVLGKSIIVTEWKMRDSAYDSSGAKIDAEDVEPGTPSEKQYVTLSFYFEKDKAMTPRFVNTGAFPVVTVVKNAIAKGTKLPVRTVLEAQKVRGGRTYRFQGKGD